MFCSILARPCPNHTRKPSRFGHLRTSIVPSSNEKHHILDTQMFEDVRKGVGIRVWFGRERDQMLQNAQGIIGNVRMEKTKDSGIKPELYVKHKVQSCLNISCVSCTMLVRPCSNYTRKASRSGDLRTSVCPCYLVLHWMASQSMFGDVQNDLV